MNISTLTQSSSISQYAGTFGRVLNTSLSNLSGVILATSAAGLVGLALYRFTQTPTNGQGGGYQFEKVKSRVCQTYAYVLGGLTATAVVSAVAHSIGLSRIMLENQFAVGAAMILTCGGLVTTIVSGPESVKTRTIAYAIFNIGMGLTLSPLAFFQKTLLAQAAMITLGIGSVLTFTAYMAPDKEFLKWEGPLMGALSTISFASCIAWFFPNTAFAYGIDRVGLYGGLLIFSGLFMSSTQKIVDEAETQPNSVFDPIKSSLSLYLDTLNIFVRILRILVENQAKDKKEKVFG